MIPAPNRFSYWGELQRKVLSVCLALIAGSFAFGQPIVWTTANAGNWSSPGTWTANAVPPTAGSMGIVTLAHSVTLDQNAIAATLNINAGSLSISGTIKLTVSGTATIANGAVFTNSNNNASNIVISNFVVSNGGTYNHNAIGSAMNGVSADFPGTTRSFGASSNVVITKWANGGTAPVALPVIGAGWGHLTINIASLGGNWRQTGALTNVQGDFTIKNTGNRELSLFSSQSGGTTFSKNVFIEGGVLCVLQSGNGNGINININGNLAMSGNGKLTLTTGSFSFISTSEPRVFLKGDLSIINTAQILQPNTTGVVAIFVFRKASGIQYFTCNNLTGVSNAYIGWGVGDHTSAGTCTNTLVLNSNFIARDFCVFRVFKNATLDCPGETVVKGAGASFFINPSGFTLYAGGNIKIGSKDGITTAGIYSGNIQTSGPRNYNTAAHYNYTGAYNQVTGNGLPSLITGSLSATNTGATGNNTVTLTTNNTETKTLNLNSGYFAAGTNKTLKISNTGSVNGIAGGDCIHLAPNGGNIHLLGNNTVTGSAPGFPHFYDITIGSGILSSPVTFPQNGTIYHYCTLNSQGTVSPAAPTYATNSTLIYNTANNAASPYIRSIEWGQAVPGAAGYPWHVVVQNRTHLNLGITVPPLLECGGNFTIGKLGLDSGTVNMNSLIQPLIVKGHLTIGDTLTGAPIGTLNLSNAAGGDLYLYGNFSRGKNSFYTDNSRTIYFKGTSDATISTPVMTITPGVPTQYFTNVRIDKTNGSEQVTLKCPVGISNEIQFIKGVVNSSATNLLSVTNANTASVTGGSDLSFVNGPMSRAINSTADYDFPVGKTGLANAWRPVSVIPSSSTSASFWAEYFVGPTPNNTTVLGSITSLENNEYWQVNRTSGSTSAVIKLNYENPGSGTANWMSMNPCSGCHVAVAQYQVSGTGYWDHTGNFESLNPAIPQTRLHTSNGPVYSAPLNSFSLASPFTAAASFNIILPVKLLYFNGKQEGKNALLQWKIEDSKDLAGFEIQHSRDGRNFSLLASVPAGVARDYKWQHINLASGSHFYRLKVKENTGKSFLSQVIKLTDGQFYTSIIGLAANALNQQVTATIISASNQKASITITDVAGRIISRKAIQLLQGENRYDIHAELLVSNGLYFLHIETSDRITATRKFTRQ
ncbi:MAG: T9SS type A sorting domain-containing protein [Bacteroidota bacterium]